MRKDKLVSGNIYHVYNRGVEKRSLFASNRDYERFVDDLIIFNDIKLVINPKQRIKDIKNGDYKRNSLVEILTFCLMPNHYHLLLRQKKDDGITEFMKKLGSGYANYFNLKHQRVGPLFQGKFKSVLIDDESQFLYIPFYIHLNPLDLNFPEWREKGIGEAQKAVKFINDYKWSGHSDYAGKSNFPLVLQKDFLKGIFDRTSAYQKNFYNFINDFDSSNTGGDFTLE